MRSRPYLCRSWGSPSDLFPGTGTGTGIDVSSDGIGSWIKDFQGSDAPQFKGKDKEERRDMKQRNKKHNDNKDEEDEE